MFSPLPPTFCRPAVLCPIKILCKVSKSFYFLIVLQVVAILHGYRDDKLISHSAIGDIQSISKKGEFSRVSILDKYMYSQFRRDLFGGKKAPNFNRRISEASQSSSTSTVDKSIDTVISIPRSPRGPWSQQQQQQQQQVFKSSAQG